MAGKSDESLHILSLVLNRMQDIPLIRQKVKLLAAAVGLPRLAVTQVATGASEMARVLTMHHGGGKVVLALVHRDTPADPGCGISMVFEGRRSASAAENGAVSDALLGLAPFRGARAVLDSVNLEQDDGGQGLRISCLKWGIPHCWEELQQIEHRMRTELFSDTDESHLENFKVKHEEVVRLLREKSVRTRELDQVNAELLLMSRNMEELARERAMAEMSLKVADRIRNPAMVIGGMANLLLGKGAAQPKAAQRLQIISQQVKKLEQAVADFEQFAGRSERLFDRENLLDLVNGALALCVTVTRKKIMVELDAPPQEIVVKAHRLSLQMGLLNLFRFVARDMVPGEKMEIRLRVVDSTSSVAVCYRPADFGGGEQQEQAELSLNLARQIIDEHHGTLRLSDDKEVPERKVLTVHFPLYWQGTLAVGPVSGPAK